MILKIDSTKTEQITVELIDPKTNKKDRLIEKQKLGSQVLLPMVAKILKKNGIDFSDLSAIEVNPGPGSFTGTRVGVAIANALGYALNIPVNGSPRFARLDSESERAREAGKKGKIVEPIYEKSKFD